MTDALKSPPFSVAMLAERWGVSRQHVNRLVKEGRPRHFKVGDKLIRIPSAEVDRWEAQLQGKGPNTSSEPSTDAASSPGGRTAADAAFASVRGCRKAN
jgi:excisionase family DNA binding protein